MKFKVGDKVKLVRTDGEEWEWYKNHLGETFTIKEIDKDWGNEEFAELEENDELIPFIKNLELVEETYTYEDLKKAPIGTKVTFEKGRTLIKIDENYYREINENGIIRYFSNLKGLKDNYLKGLKDNYHDYLNQGRIIKIEEPTYKTVYEVKTEILDNTEKRYLKDVIRPFRDRVKYIEKRNISRGDYIRIMIQDTNICDLPYFEKDTMYKGMKLYRHYTLKELGI